MQLDLLTLKTNWYPQFEEELKIFQEVNDYQSLIEKIESFIKITPEDFY